MIRPAPPPDFEPFPRGEVVGSIPGRWSRVAARYPSRPALLLPERTLTYAELDAAAGRYARQIAALVPGTGANVAILLDDVAAQIPAALGVLMAGHAFVILDPSHPREHNERLIDHVQAALVLREVSAGGSAAAPKPPTVRIPPHARAYLVYTSGSTGTPKGVEQSHRNVLHNVYKYANSLGVAPSDRHSLLGSLNFAAAMTDMFGTLLTGACLCPYPLRLRGVDGLSDWVRRERVTVVHTVPTAFRRWAGSQGTGGALPDLRVIKLGGEPVLRDDVAAFRRGFRPPALLLHSLGSSELNTIRQLFIGHAEELPPGSAVPVGYEVPETPVAVVDGEIVVRSDFLSAGYWREPELTARVFPGDGRTFMTGDSGRLLPDGCLVHLGRRDERVKLRGVSIEPAEIESAIRAAGLAQDAAVVARDEPPRLVAFVVGCAEPGGVRGALSVRLPAAYLPEIIHQLPELPLLANGKVDRRALAMLALEEPAPPAQAPRDALERTLCALFSRALPRRTAFGVEDSFFELGGDSLAAAQLFAAVARVLQVELPLAELKLHPTVGSLAARIRAGGWNLTDNPVALLTPSPDAAAENLFLWPGAGADVLALADLARALGPGIASHAIQHRGADGRRVYDTSVGAMADRSVRLIRQVQPSGPYALCGGSFGGIVALETARRLRAAGERVDYLSLLDTYAPGNPVARRNLSLAGRVLLLARRLRPIGRKDDPRLSALGRGLLSNVVRVAARRIVRHAAPGARPLPLPWRFIFLQEACFTALRAYRPEPFDGDLTLFRVDSPPPANLFEQDTTLGWRGVVTGSLRVVTVAGSHDTQLQEPFVSTLAPVLRAELFLARGRTRTSSGEPMIAAQNA